MISTPSIHLMSSVYFNKLAVHREFLAEEDYAILSSCLPVACTAERFRFSIERMGPKWRN